MPCQSKESFGENVLRPTDRLAPENDVQRKGKKEVKEKKEDEEIIKSL